MPRQRKNEIIMGQFFKWKVFRRDRVYQADGRGNPQPVGRHSLGTKNHDQAMENLRRLDLVKAVEFGLTDPSILRDASEALSLQAGVDLYRAHIQRPAVTGGASPGTWKRYRAVFDKAVPFWKKVGISSWNQLRKAHLESYAAWLDDKGYAYRTEFLELTTIKQAVNWLIEEGHLPSENQIRLPLTKPKGTDTYCWRTDEVTAMLDLCKAAPQLQWLHGVITALTCTGMRISELASLRWSDVDDQQEQITLKDETTSRRQGITGSLRQTKSRRTRSFPIHSDLRAVLGRIEHAADGLIFHGPKGGGLRPDLVRLTLIRDVLTPLSERFPTADGEIGFTDGRLHSFRHYFCSTCANSNVPEQMVMEWLGHQESKMVRHYYHVHNEEAQRQMQRLRFTEDPATS